MDAAYRFRPLLRIAVPAALAVAITTGCVEQPAVTATAKTTTGGRNSGRKIVVSERTIPGGTTATRNLSASSGSTFPSSTES